VHYKVESLKAHAAKKKDDATVERTGLWRFQLTNEVDD
jgi:hypothetical protein